MAQLHVRAEPSDIAPFVLLPGDPQRAEFIAETFFDNPVCYNRYRYLLGFTGTYKGMPVTVQTTGMGCPSLAIVVEEIIRLGAKQLVRVGTAGIISREVQPTDHVVATAASCKEGTSKMYLGTEPPTPAPSFGLTRALVNTAMHTATKRPTHTGLIQTEDAFYATTPDDVAALAARGVLAVEMESSALFTLGQLRRVEAATILVASNYIGDPAFVDADKLQASVKDMVEVALEAGLSLAQ
jgi:purine-nucleoside phosphorylase